MSNIVFNNDKETIIKRLNFYPFWIMDFRNKIIDNQLSYSLEECELMEILIKLFELYPDINSIKREHIETLVKNMNKVNTYCSFIDNFVCLCREYGISKIILD
ncbi:hypothetical protein CQA53_08865 [Helicobacter didelphidarum]|uniref:Uncharacterized protein n=1 Tax=Helicobacter didelphidarum TaxID=2040648 RepID=A0A3D8IEF2_9HELI|nr:hypothetical protein CQA53_08865 [Helicobacter didelphidarum]